MLTLIMGKSCAGKDYKAREMAKAGYKLLPECTTRPRRNNEIAGTDKIFLSEAEFQNRVLSGDIVEQRTYKAFWENKPVEWLYGTPNEFKFYKDTDFIYAVDMFGIVNLVKAVPEHIKEIIYLDVSDEIREQRARNRVSFYEPEWLRRKADDNIKYNETRIALVADLWGKPLTRIEVV